MSCVNLKKNWKNAMWDHNYSDYPKDSYTKRYRQESRTQGCEMNEIYGWGAKEKINLRKSPTFLRSLLALLGIKKY